MGITPQEFQSFSEFGLARLHGTDHPMSLDDLVLEWDRQHYKDDIDAAIKQGIADADAGRYKPADAVFKSLLAKHGLSE